MSDGFQKSLFFLNNLASRVAKGGFGGFSPQTMYQAPQIEKWNTVNHWRFYQIFNIKPPRHKRKAPHKNVKTPSEDFLATVLYSALLYDSE